MKKLIKKILNKRSRESEFRKNKIKVHPKSNLGKATQIGYGTQINGPVFINSREGAPVCIGKYCAVAHNLRIRPRNHKTGYANLQYALQARHKFKSLATVKGPITIGNGVWIGDNVIILSGVTVGDGAVLGAGAIVTKDVPPYAVAAGNPARVIRYRFSEHIIAQMLEIQWWNWPEAKISRNRKFFETDFAQFPDLDISSLIVD